MIDLSYYRLDAKATEAGPQITIEHFCGWKHDLWLPRRIALSDVCIIAEAHAADPGDRCVWP